MRAITTQCSGLITFECNGDCVPAAVSHLTDDTFYKPKIAHLVELCLDGNPYVSDTTLECVSANCTALTRLSVSGTNVTIDGIFRTTLHFNLEVLCYDRIAKSAMDATMLRALGIQLAPTIIHFEGGLGHITENDTSMNDEVMVFVLRCNKLQTFGLVPRHLHDRLTQFAHVHFKIYGNYPASPSSVPTKFGGSRLGHPVGVENFRYTKRV